MPTGAAIRILTGATLPEGVDTVVLEEDTASDGASVVFDGPIKTRAYTREAGEAAERESAGSGNDRDVVEEDVGGAADGIVHLGAPADELVERCGESTLDVVEGDWA